MTFTIRPISLRKGIVLTGVAYLMVVAACGPSESGTSHGCSYSTSGNWPFSGVFDPGNPASCPIVTPPGGRDQRYEANASIPTGASTGTGSLTFLNYQGSGVTQSAAVLYTGGYGYDLYVFAGHYTAGTIAAASGQTGHDLALNQIVLSGGGAATATAVLTYQTSAAAGVLGTSNIDPGQSAVLSGEYYQSDLLPPVSFQWYRDGSAISGASGATLTVYPSSANTTNSYEFRVTDSESRTVSAFHDVITSAGCGTQVECD